MSYYNHPVMYNGMSDAEILLFDEQMEHKITLEENLRRVKGGRKNMQTHDIIRKFNGEVGMVLKGIDWGHSEPIVIYKSGYDFLDDIKSEIKQIARPSEPWMYVPDNWEDNRLWDECTVSDVTCRTMTIAELENNEDIHATLGYRLIIEED